MLVALLLTARYTFHRGPRAGYLLIVVSIAWLLLDKSMEGATVVTVSRNHGLTAADLAGLVGVALGVRQAWPDLVRRLKRLTGGLRR